MAAVSVLENERREPVDVLIVDDDVDAADVLAEMLGKLGYSVRTASNGREALTALESIEPCLMLLDLQMPVMDGMEFREAQRRNPELLAIPTVVVTASEMETMLDPAVAATLQKPLRKADLLPIVEQYCSPRS